MIDKDGLTLLFAMLNHSPWVFNRISGRSDIDQLRRAGLITVDIHIMRGSVTPAGREVCNIIDSIGKYLKENYCGRDV